MRRTALVILAPLLCLPFVITACPGMNQADCTDLGTCDCTFDEAGICHLDDGSAEGSLADGANPDGNMVIVEGGTIDAPPGCTLTQDPKDSPACVADSVGVFVDALGGSDGNDGSKAKPFQTIAKAVASAGPKPRVYVCAGSYTDNVSLDAAHAPSIYGGFACGAWTYATSNAVIVKPASGYALQVASVAATLVIADAEFDAPAGTTSSVNSIAAFVASSPAVTMKRLKIVAADAAQGANGDPGALGALMTAAPGATLDGNNGDANNGGAQQVCTCVNGGTSKGGKGGNNVAGAAANGATGETAQAVPSPATATGAGQLSADCTTIRMGGMAPSAKPGSNAPDQSPAQGASVLGALSDQGWTPQGGGAGQAGQAGQGGGGGGGNSGGGGGGGCGGCGGGGGKAGGGGGASVGLATFNSTVTLTACSFTTGNAGPGGSGGGAGSGIAGGNSGNKGGSGCDGANGGTGGAGGAGGGGAGGVSVGILYKGTKPTYAGDTTFVSGTLGGKGIGGAAGTNDGIDGKKGDTLAVP